VQSVTPPTLAERRSELAIAGEPIPAVWEETVAACLAKDPSQRPQTAGEVARRLELAGRSVEVQSAPPDSVSSEPSLKNGATESPRVRKSKAPFVVAIAVLALGVMAYSFWPRTGPAPAKSSFEPSSAKLVTAFDETKANAERGDPDAQFSLGLMYANGTGVQKDSAEAVKWYRIAADRGNAMAQRALGWCYENGDGVAKDEIEALA
jgi:TPR repeat protein